jgi:hypothetical protein
VDAMLDMSVSESAPSQASEGPVDTSPCGFDDRFVLAAAILVREARV